MPQPRIAMICSSPELGRRFEALASTRGLALEAHVAALEKALPLARDLAARGLADVIVACRGTAALLANELELPVVPVQPASLSLISALFELVPSHRSLFVPRCAGESCDFAFFEAQTGVQVHTAFYCDLASLDHIIAQCAQLRLGPVVGGGWACSLAARYHAGFKLVMPGLDELSLALDAAQALAESMARRRSAMAGVSALLDGGKSPKAPVWHIPYAWDAPAGTPAGRVGAGASGAPGASSEAGGTVRPSSAGPAEAGAQEILFQAFDESPDAASEACCSLDDYLFASDEVAALLERLRRFAQSGSHVLITGERGTGKAMLASGLHRASDRADRPFAAVDCQALPADLLASRLFGTADGKPGLFDELRGGTLFLSQADAMPGEVQTLLLRAIQRQEGELPSSCVRIVAAVRRPMAEAVHEGRMRADLYYRLNALSVCVPPLRERTEDISLYVEAFVESASREAGLAPLALPSQCMERLLRHPWPGNARQLRRFCELLVERCRGRFFLEAFDGLFSELCAGLEPASRHPVPAAADVSRHVQIRHQAQSPMLRPRDALVPVAQPERRPGSLTLSAITPTQVDEALRRAGGRKKEAAALLGISRTSLWRLIRGRAQAQEA
ncbi:MAG: sigma 54-interacting transcriptional regulator [Desulfovibrio sp.]|nr:sigma 54-interacting transcriptional regulator [Desulfovibrio sp.]